MHVYLIEPDNFAAMQMAARDGDRLASHLLGAINHFMNNPPRLECALCDQPLDNMTFVILFMDTMADSSWTTCICEDCRDRADLEDILCDSLAAHAGINTTLH
jgi:hypothetical protein